MYMRLGSDAWLSLAIEYYTCTCTVAGMAKIEVCRGQHFKRTAHQGPISAMTTELVAIFVACSESTWRI